MLSFVGIAHFSKNSSSTWVGPIGMWPYRMFNCFFASDLGLPSITTCQIATATPVGLKPDPTMHLFYVPDLVFTLTRYAPIVFSLGLDVNYILSL